MSIALRASTVAAALAFALPVMAQQGARQKADVVTRSPDPAPRAIPASVGMSAERLADIGNMLRADVERGRLPGAVVAIVRKGRLVYFEAVGFQDKAAGVPMTTGTIFNIASMTKPMAAVAGLQLYEQGRLLMDEPVDKYVPKFKDLRVAVMDDKQETITDRVAPARRMTIQDLYRHTSGMVYGGRGATAVHKLYPSGSTPSAASMTGPEFLGKLAGVPLLHQPGAVWDYGFGLDVLGLIVEGLTEKTLGQYLQDNVWLPLGMADTHFLIPAAKAARYAKALPNDPDTGQPQPTQDLTKPLKFECGGGCSASTAADYMRFALMLMNKGQYGGKRVLSRKTVDFMLANHLGPQVKNLLAGGDPTRADYGFGLGLAVRTTPGVVRMMGSVGDFSWPGASGTNWWVDPQEQLAVVFMSAAPGPIRWHYRQAVNAMVYRALVD